MLDTLFTLAVIPGISLMIYIYKKDKKEKEPIALLLALFGLGALSVIPIAILEALFDFVDETNSIIELIIKCVFVIGFFEELGKFVFLRLFTWKNKNFNCSFDAIVYSVFVSLGFATIENILYVFTNGFFVGILRAVTAVPGHASFAVIMGYFYSKMRKAKADGNTGAVFVNLILAITMPMLVHGIYDALALSGTFVSFLIFVGYVIAMFVTCFIIVKRAAKNDSPFEPVQNILIVPNMPVSHSWYCIKCGYPNSNNFCIRCGSPKY